MARVRLNASPSETSFDTAINRDAATNPDPCRRPLDRTAATETPPPRETSWSRSPIPVCSTRHQARLPRPLLVDRTAGDCAGRGASRSRDRPPYGRAAGCAGTRRTDGSSVRLRALADTSHGTPLEPRNINHEWAKVCVSAGITPRSGDEDHPGNASALPTGADRGPVHARPARPCPGTSCVHPKDSNP